MKEDLQAVRDEAAASKEVIAVLRKQVEELQKEKETLWVDADALHTVWKFEDFSAILREDLAPQKLLFLTDFT